VLIFAILGLLVGQAWEAHNPALDQGWADGQSWDARARIGVDGRPGNSGPHSQHDGGMDAAGGPAVGSRAGPCRTAAATRRRVAAGRKSNGVDIPRGFARPRATVCRGGQDAPFGREAPTSRVSVSTAGIWETGDTAASGVQASEPDCASESCGEASGWR
jgi:hypothetical protein